ncbi:ribonuclease P protein component [Candidatus Uabimicrobium sp. HlEnr_7]|uniref:ribonuclease P protein component n=1 Tax=Candidatus Uabimicrobium helgolandensis TaxID=3095367 RepID=UPI003556953A
METTKNFFPQTSRLRSKSDFSNVFLKKRSHSGRFLRCYYRKNSLSVTRIGIVVGRKYGKAHERNKFKRIVREAFRLYDQQNFPMDIVILPLKRNKSLQYEDLSKDIWQLLRKSYKRLGYH